MKSRGRPDGASGTPRQIVPIRVEMRQAIRDFGTELRRAQMGLFYFAGHGVQVRGKNFTFAPRPSVAIGGVLASLVVGSDHYVVALASEAPMLLRPLGIDIPVYPVKGYSLTVPIVDSARAPESTVMDETYKVAVTRLGDRIRVGTTVLELRR